MIIYNVTVKVDLDIHEEWLKWMRDIHIPDVLKTGLFTESRICKVLVNEEDGVTYAIQYTCKNMSDYKKYESEHAPRLQQEHREKYHDKALAFRTLLEVL